MDYFLDYASACNDASGLEFSREGTDDLWPVSFEEASNVVTLVNRSVSNSSLNIRLIPITAFFVLVKFLITTNPTPRYSDGIQSKFTSKFTPYVFESHKYYIGPSYTAPDVDRPSPITSLPAYVPYALPPPISLTPPSLAASALPAYLIRRWLSNDHPPGYIESDEFNHDEPISWGWDCSFIYMRKRGVRSGMRIGKGGSWRVS